VRFGLPDEKQRAELWRAMLPVDAPFELALDFDDLGREFPMTGGYIKNAALRAAYLAVHEKSAISMGHLRRGARTELEAMGKVVRAA
jgi:hypothetical protein